MFVGEVSTTVSSQRLGRVREVPMSALTGGRARAIGSARRVYGDVQIESVRPRVLFTESGYEVSWAVTFAEPKGTFESLFDGKGHFATTRFAPLSLVAPVPPPPQPCQPRKDDSRTKQDDLHHVDEFVLEARRM